MRFVRTPSLKRSIPPFPVDCVNVTLTLLFPDCWPLIHTRPPVTHLEKNDTTPSWMPVGILTTAMPSPSPTQYASLFRMPTLPACWSHVWPLVAFPNASALALAKLSYTCRPSEMRPACSQKSRPGYRRGLICPPNAVREAACWWVTRCLRRASSSGVATAGDPAEPSNTPPLAKSCSLRVVGIEALSAHQH